MVERPTVIFGKTQSGKTYHAFRLFERHQGPAIFCDIQWRRFRTGLQALTFEEIVSLLKKWKDGPAPHIIYLPRDYGELARLIPYLLDVHRLRHLEGRPLPTMAVFLDEMNLAANRWSPDDLPAIRLFTQGYQHKVVGVGIVQWPSQMNRMVMVNAIDQVYFALNPREELTLSRDYRIDIPDRSWNAYRTYRYWRYDGDWYKGDRDGEETPHSGPSEETPSIPEEEGTEPVDDLPEDFEYIPPD
jgi:hypothetical protein